MEYMVESAFSLVISCLFLIILVVVYKNRYMCTCICAHVSVLLHKYNDPSSGDVLCTLCVHAVYIQLLKEVEPAGVSRDEEEYRDEKEVDIVRRQRKSEMGHLEYNNQPYIPRQRMPEGGQHYSKTTEV
eukprot:GHVS01062761.1.p1 GENE.GHVS01062761.1~~GHVS01062761.1.p1  ORF type:complete len:129 (-),score=21.40 GHVS01062761.1:215-601(-)